MTGPDSDRGAGLRPLKWRIGPRRALLDNPVGSISMEEVTDLLQPAVCLLALRAKHTGQADASLMRISHHDGRVLRASGQPRRSAYAPRVSSDP
jgi:hypothetical protein